MRRTRLVSIAALLAAGSVALGACSSSGGGTTNPPSSGGSTTGGSGSSSPAGAGGCEKGTMDAEGSTAQANAMDAWIKAYQQKCGATITYNPTGSGDGVTSFLAGQHAFVGSDSALDSAKGEITGAQKRCKSAPLDLPMVVGPIAIAFKLNGVQKLTLDGPTIAKIFLGRIKTWNDPAIAKLNSGVKLPRTKISVFYRSDSSGTTQNFERYLAATAGGIFKPKPDKDSSKSGFVGQGKAKSQGVADAVSHTDGGITYTEFSYAVSSGLATASIDNGTGPVELSKDTASAAAGAAKVVGTGKDLSLSLDYATKATGAYPIILVTYEVVCSAYSDAAQGKLVKSFLSYTAGDGQSLLPQLGYAPLPAELQTKVQAAIASSN
ncbi:MAG: phosphate ABC transporter substrate-binding protein PstS [Jatrophihabitantaceae bacterium]